MRIEFNLRVVYHCVVVEEDYNDNIMKIHNKGMTFFLFKCLNVQKMNESKGKKY